MTTVALERETALTVVPCARRKVHPPRAPDLSARHLDNSHTGAGTAVGTGDRGRSTVKTHPVPGMLRA